MRVARSSDKMKRAEKPKRAERPQAEERDEPSERSPVVEDIEPDWNGPLPSFLSVGAL